MTMLTATEAKRLRALPTDALRLTEDRFQFLRLAFLRQLVADLPLEAAGLLAANYGPGTRLGVEVREWSPEALEQDSSATRVAEVDPFPCVNEDGATETRLLVQLKHDGRIFSAYANRGSWHRVQAVQSRLLLRQLTEVPS